MANPLNRKVVWFSCGAPSAVAAKIVASSEPCEIVYTEVIEEHEDNKRFLSDCEGWIGQKITVLGNDKYGRSIYEVFRRERYLIGFNGAPCTKLLKRRVREMYQRTDDIHILGYTSEECGRLDEFRKHFPELTVECPLIERGLGKADCLGMIELAGIEIPAMYRLGYNNNNCIGCVKGGIGYWNKIRITHPERFDRMAKLEREIGYALLRQGKDRVFLDELDPSAGRNVPEPKIDCSIMCLTTIQEYSA